MHKIFWAYSSNANLPQCIPSSKREASSSADLADKIIVDPRPVCINVSQFQKTPKHLGNVMGQKQYCTNFY